MVLLQCLLFWLTIGFIARCALKFIVYDIVARYNKAPELGPKEFWKKYMRRLQYMIIAMGPFGFFYIVHQLNKARHKGKPVEWRLGLKL